MSYVRHVARSKPSRLAGFTLFDDLSAKELKAIESLMAPLDISAGREFIKEGSPGGEAFLILEVQVSVWRDGRLIATRGPGTVIGEMALITGAKRAASVKAETDLETDALGRREFSTLLHDNPRLTNKILAAGTEPHPISTLQRCC